MCEESHLQCRHVYVGSTQKRTVMIFKFTLWWFTSIEERSFSLCQKKKKPEGDKEGEKNEVWAGDREKKRKAEEMPEWLSEQGIHIQAEGSGARLAHRERRSPEDKMACGNISLPVCRSSGLTFHTFSRIPTLTTTYEHQGSTLSQHTDFKGQL